MPDLKQHAQQIVATWPKLSTSQHATIGNIVGGAK